MLSVYHQKEFYEIILYCVNIALIYLLIAAESCSQNIKECHIVMKLKVDRRRNVATCKRYCASGHTFALENFTPFTLRLISTINNFLRSHKIKNKFAIYYETQRYNIKYIRRLRTLSRGSSNSNCDQYKSL